MSSSLGAALAAISPRNWQRHGSEGCRPSARRSRTFHDPIILSATSGNSSRLSTAIGTSPQRFSIGLDAFGLRRRAAMPRRSGTALVRSLTSSGPRACDDKGARRQRRRPQPAPEPASDIAALWSATVNAAGVFAVAAALGLALIYWVIGRALAPLVDLSRGLGRDRRQRLSRARSRRRARRSFTACSAASMPWPSGSPRLTSAIARSRPNC